MKLDQFLKQAGFRDNEATVYLSALENGASSPVELSQKTNLPRTTVNLILKHLVERGVVGKILIKKRVRYLAEPPDKLITELRELAHHAEQLLPQLNARYNDSEHKPKIKFYEGAHAVQKVYDDTLMEKPEEILEWNTDEYFNAKKNIVDPYYIDKRVKLNIKAKRIAAVGSGWDLKHHPYDSSELSETVIIPKNIFSPEIEVNIYGKKVAFLNYAENMSVIIESRAIADAMRQAYKLSWLGAKNLEKQNPPN